MTCPNCGTSNLDTATICINCGRPLTSASGAASTSYTPPPPPTTSSYSPPPPAGGYPGAGPIAPPPAGGSNPVIWLILSILGLLCCCNPIALVPLIFSIMAMSARSAGRYAEAEVNARRAMLWFWITVATTIVWYIVWFGFMGGMTMIEQFREQMEAAQ